MNQKLKLTLALSIGLLGGGTLTHFLSPAPVFAQTQLPVLTLHHMALVTRDGVTLGDFNSDEGTIKLSPVVKLNIQRTDRTVTIEISDGKNSK